MGDLQGLVFVAVLSSIVACSSEEKEEPRIPFGSLKLDVQLELVESESFVPVTSEAIPTYPVFWLYIEPLNNLEWYYKDGYYPAYLFGNTVDFYRFKWVVNIPAADEKEYADYLTTSAPDISEAQLAELRQEIRNSVTESSEGSQVIPFPHIGYKVSYFEYDRHYNRGLSEEDSYNVALLDGPCTRCSIEFERPVTISSATGPVTLGSSFELMFEHVVDEESREYVLVTLEPNADTPVTAISGIMSDPPMVLDCPYSHEVTFVRETSECEYNDPY